MKLSNEAKVGIMVTAAFVLLAILTFKTGNFKIYNKGYAIKVDFQNVDGVSTNSPVMFNGFEVGRVKGVAIKDEVDGVKMELTVWLNEGVKVHQDARAYVKNMGFLGEKYVGLTSGDAKKSYLQAGDLIVGNEPADLDKVLAQAQEITAIINQKLKNNDQAIDRIFVNLDKTMANATSITDNVNERLAVNKTNIDEIVTNLKSTSVNLDLMTYDIMMNPWKLIFRTKEQKLEDLEFVNKHEKK